MTEGPPRSDGCTFIGWLWNKVTGHPPPFIACCHAHDIDYVTHRRSRKASDRRYFRCVWNQGHPFWAAVMYPFVRLVGGLWYYRNGRRE